MPLLEVFFPHSKNVLDQDQEYFILNGEHEGEGEKIAFHDYRKIYNTPGLYEEIFHNLLKCQSPQVTKELLCKNVKEQGGDPTKLRVLDFGAGNGLVAEALQEENPELIVGVDILKEARNAAMRDRPEVYQDYFVTDLGNPEKGVSEKLKACRFNALITVAALGFAHIPPESFINAFNLVEQNGWVTFNLRDRFLTEEDNSGFRNALNLLEHQSIEILDKETYVHRLSSTGEPIHYTAFVGRKLSDIKI